MIINYRNLFKTFTRPHYFISNIYAHKNDFHDILIMKKQIDVKDTQKYNYYFYFKSQKLTFPGDLTVLQFENEIANQIPDVFSVSTHIQDAKNDIQFSGTTPLYLVAQEDFHLKLNNIQNYIILTKVDDPPVIDRQMKYSILSHSLETHFEKIDQPRRQSIVLQTFIQRIISELSKTNLQMIDRQYIQMIVKKIILKDGLLAKSQKSFIDAQIAFLELKLIKLENIKKEIISELEGQEKQQLHLIYLYLILQIAFTQYGTYYVWGWDVMEPVTFMIGVFDMIVAYIFWMRTRKSYWFDNVLKVAVQKRLDKKFEEKFNYSNELFDVQRMIEYLKFKQMIYSTNVDDVLQVIEGAIEGKQAKDQQKVQEEEEDE